MISQCITAPAPCATAEKVALAEMSFVPTTPLTIEQVKQENIQSLWQFVRMGIDDVIRKAHPDFIAEDVYASLRTGAAFLWMVTRGPRVLGFFISHPQKRPFSGRVEYFLWCVWTLKLRDRIDSDNWPEVHAMTIQHWVDTCKAWGGDRVVTITKRKGYERYGFRLAFKTYEMRI